MSGSRVFFMSGGGPTTGCSRTHGSSSSVFFVGGVVRFFDGLRLFVVRQTFGYRKVCRDCLSVLYFGWDERERDEDGNSQVRRWL